MHPKSNPLSAVFAVIALLAGPCCPASQDLPPLPEGSTGIASKYPGDKGIEKAPGVLFVDDFEQSNSVADLSKKWDVLINEAHLAIALDADPSPGGGKSLLTSIPKQGEPLATAVDKQLAAPVDRLFLRWYMKFEDAWAVPGDSVHNGASISARYFDNGRATPGIPADGRNKFLANFECENANGPSPGFLNVYVYWPEQGDKWGDHFFPSGMVLPFSFKRSGTATFGAQFKARRDFAPQPGRWVCYEYMVQANTPGQRDGRIAMWVDGALVADFPNLRLRDVADLRIDRFGLGLYIAANTGRANRKWHDNVVAATSYIGPISPAKQPDAAAGGPH